MTSQQTVPLRCSAGLYLFGVPPDAVAVQLKESGHCVRVPILFILNNLHQDKIGFACCLCDEIAALYKNIEPRSIFSCALHHRTRLPFVRVIRRSSIKSTNLASSRIDQTGRNSRRIRLQATSLHVITVHEVKWSVLTFMLALAINLCDIFGSSQDVQEEGGTWLGNRVYT